jgi:hypothetical protein
VAHRCGPWVAPRAESLKPNTAPSYFPPRARARSPEGLRQTA